MNNSVAWDSEYYLSIAIRGYDDPRVGSVRDYNRVISKNYAFLPFYPLMIRIFALPFNLFTNPIAAASLAGVIISILGAITAAAALFFLINEKGEDKKTWKTVFFFLIFPTSFFLAQVYTEGLFLGLAFSTLALTKFKKLGWASFLAVLAVWTKVVGICLIIPLAWSWFENFKNNKKKINSMTILNMLYILAPIAAFLLWYWSPLGRNFNTVEKFFFNRRPLNLASSFKNWSLAFKLLFSKSPQTRIYYLIEFGAIAFGLTTCILTIKKMPALSIFGLLIILISLTSGESQGMSRYILAAPSIFILLGQWGEKSEIFDRSWTIASLLLFGMMTTAYTLNMWVG